MRNARAYTLIELLVAIALGVVLVGSSMAAVRVATQSVTTSNRLAVENSLMRAGFLAALDEVDTWRMCDDPSRPDGTTLRAYDATLNRGMAFTPFTAIDPADPLRVPGFRLQRGPSAEEDRGWDPDYAWPQDDPRLWYHGNLAERLWQTDRAFGHHELFAHIKTRPMLDRTFPIAGTPSATHVAFGGEAAPRHTWLFNQVEGLKNALGYYAVCDYLPSNAIYSVIGYPGRDNRYGVGPVMPPDTTASTGENDMLVPPEWGHSAWEEDSRASDALSVSRDSQDYPMNPSWFSFAVSDNDTRIPRGLYRITKESQFCLIPGNRSSPPAMRGYTAAELVQFNHRRYYAGQFSTVETVQRLYHRALLRDALVPVAPAHWPAIEVGVLRLVIFSRFANICRVRWRSPVSGQVAELSFNAFGTTLRGARRQRRASDDPLSPDHGLDLDGGKFGAP
ncbi:MAG TPA: prepilin-type N-terminal cleavage/methylation domain-containing protein [Planctomycetota bacterium]|nr:prepilin-type N-terminal cleavage/methylation domain-containing protein [Planctomycetota bacterium]